MMKFNKEKIESFIGWISLLIVVINIFFPVVGIIAGVLFISQHYISLILASLGIFVVTYIVKAFKYLTVQLKKH